jgi:hypothetical protein
MTNNPLTVSPDGRKSQTACLVKDGKPSWDDAPEWAKGLFWEGDEYYWSSDWTINTWSVEPRPKS